MSLRPPPPLPLELGGISDDRREQLENRRQREMARQQEQSGSRLGSGEFRWSPIAMIPAHLCVLIFLIFLLEKLEGSIDWPWAAVLSPLWITDAVFIVVKSKEVRRIVRMTENASSEAYALFPPIRGIIDHVGIAAAKVTLVYRLEDKVDWSLLLLFTPMWVCVLVAGSLRCITPPHPQVTGEQVAFHKAGAFFTGLFHLVARGAQPMLIVLKIEGQVDGSWASVFVPLWMFMGATALAGSALCCCAPMVSRGVIPEIRPLLIRGMLLCSVGTFSLAFCALLFLVFLTLDLDGNENVSPSTILAPLIALYALILVFLPLLLLITRHYVRTMRTAEEQFRQANDPSGANDGGPAFGGGGGEGVAGGGDSGFAPPPAAEGARPRRRGSMMAPTILMRESSTLFRRASVSFCRRLGEADGSLVDSDLMAFEFSDWGRRGRASRSQNSERINRSGSDGGDRVPQRSSRSFHALQDFLPQASSAIISGGQRFTAAVAGTAARDSHGRFTMSAERQRAGEEKEASPRQRGGQGAGSKSSPEDERHDRCLLQGDSGTHSVTDSYDLNSFGSYVDSDEENHEVGLSIDGDEDDEDRDGAAGGGDLGLAGLGGGGGSSIGGTSFHPAPTPSPEILLAFGSAHGAAAFSLHGGSASGHGTGGLGVSRHRWSAGRDPSRRGGGGGGGGLGGVGGVAGGLPRRVSWPGGMSTSDVGLEGTGRGGDEEGVPDIEAGIGGGVGGSIEVGPDARRRSTCFICCEREADAVVMECGHGGMCTTCAEHLANTPPSQCPVCRKTIREVLTIGGIVTVASGGSLAAIAGGGEDLQKPEERRPSGTRIGGLGSSSSSAAAAVAAAGATALSRTAGSSSNLQAAAARVSGVGSGTFRRFAGPDVVGASASVAGVSGQGVGEGGVGAEVGVSAQRESLSPARRDDSPRLDLEAQGMWLDPV